MQKYIDVVRSTTGVVIPGASVTVYLAGTSTVATIYSDNGVTTTANPITGGTDGYYSFYAANGRYDLVIVKTGYNFTASETAAVRLFDPQDLMVSVKDAPYFAKGDGVANDTAAFTSAGAGSGVVQVWVPSGTYLLSSSPTPTGDVTWIFQAGATTTGAGVLPGKIIKFGSTQSALSILNQKITANIAGEAPGLKIGIASGTETAWTSNPVTSNWVTLYPYISSSAVRNKIWAANPIVDVPSGSPATAWSMEVDMNVGTSNAPDPRSTNHAVGVDVVSGGTFAPSAAFLTNGTSLANRWKHGIWFDYVGGQTGSTLIKTNTNVSVDFGLDFSTATVNFQGVRIGSTPAGQVAPIALRQFANNQVGLFLQRFTDTAPTGNILQVTNAANSVVLFAVDATGTMNAGSINTAGNITTTGVAQGTAFQSTGVAPTVGAGVIAYGATTATSATAGANGAVPAQVAGYIIINVAGTTQKIPYFNN